MTLRNFFNWILDFDLTIIFYVFIGILIVGYILNSIFSFLDSKDERKLKAELEKSKRDEHKLKMKTDSEYRKSTWKNRLKTVLMAVFWYLIVLPGSAIALVLIYNLIKDQL